MTFEQAYQAYLDEGDPGHYMSMEDLFKWFYGIGYIEGQNANQANHS